MHLRPADLGQNCEKCMRGFTVLVMKILQCGSGRTHNVHHYLWSCMLGQHFAMLINVDDMLNSDRW